MTAWHVLFGHESRNRLGINSLYGVRDLWHCVAAGSFWPPAAGC